MKRKVKVQVQTEKRGLFGVKRKVLETHTIELDGKTYTDMKRSDANRPFSLEEMMLFDDLFYDD